MAQVKQFSRGWSINRLAEEFGIDRRTVTKRLAEGNAPTAGVIDGRTVYALKDVAAIVQGYADRDTAVKDPSALPPLERRAYYQSENERLKVEVATGALIPAPEVEERFAALVKMVSQFFDTLPDVLERDIGLTAEQVVRVQDSCDRVRQAMYEAVIADEDTDARESA